MSNRIPTDWQPAAQVYDKADKVGMDPQWVKEQLARFIEITEDKGQSLNRHFDNFLQRNHKQKKPLNTTRPQPPEWESPTMEKTDQATAQSYLAKIRESL